MGRASQDLRGFTTNYFGRCAICKEPIPELHQTCKCGAFIFDVDPQPKQRQLIDMLLAKGQDIPVRIGYGGSRGAAKALDVDTPIPTPKGWATMRDLRPGDEVFTDSGEVTTVVADSGVFVSKRCVTVTFSDGSQIICDENHLWLTWTRGERTSALHCNDEWRAQRRATRKSRSKGKRPDVIVSNLANNPALMRATEVSGGVRTTIEIRSTLTVNHKHEVNHAVILPKPIQLPAEDLPIDPYVLGAWLGDGHSAGGSITSADPEIISHIASRGYVPRKNNALYLYGIPGLYRPLRLAGLLGNKHVPKIYLRASFDQRLEFLRGLMDTDGTVSKRGECCFSSTNYGIADAVHELCLTLGIKSVIREADAKLYGRYICPYWRVRFYAELSVFRLPRKRDRQKRSGFNGVSTKRYIVAVEPCSSRPVKCISVSHPSGMFLAGKSFIPTHNSRGLRDAALIVASEVAQYLPGIVIYIVRTVWGDCERNHVQEFEREHLSMMEWYTGSASIKEFTFPQGMGYPRITFGYGDTFKDLRRFTRGPNIYLMMVDQAEGFPEDQLEELHTPNRWPAAGPGGAKTAYFFNPGGPGSDWLKRVFFSKEFNLDRERATDYAFLQGYGWDNFHGWFANENIMLNGIPLTKEEFYKLPGDVPACPSGKYDREWLNSIADYERFKIFVTQTSEGKKMWSKPDSIRMGELFGRFDQFSGQYFSGSWRPDKIVI